MNKFERLNSSIDIIPLPLQCSSSTQNNMANRQLPQLANMDIDNSGRIFRDPLIIARVKQYLYENEDKVYIDVNEMADCLQRKFREYRGKKRLPFRAMVRRAYDHITENITMRKEGSWVDDDDEIDLETDQSLDQVMPSDFMQQTYGKRPASGLNGNNSNQELIDISSDDEQSPKSNSAHVSNKFDESMEVVTQEVKRPHLCASAQLPSKKSFYQMRDHREPAPAPTPTPEQQMQFRGPPRAPSEKMSRKRPRDKEDEDFSMISKKKKDFAVSVPKLSFASIGGNRKVLETVATLLVHIKHPEMYKKLGIAPPRGFLLHGPPGCGKTLLAHCIAGEVKVPLIKVAAPELIAGVSGESESRIRDLFDQATSMAPCILFIDEVDAIAPNRASATKEMERRIVSQLLSCLDELAMKDNGNKVVVLGATNRPDSLDPALRRAGRFDREISLGIPDKEARTAILEVHTKGICLSPGINLSKISELTPGFVGADLVALIREAAMIAVSRIFEKLEADQLSAIEAEKVEKQTQMTKAKDDKKEETPEKEPVISEGKILENKTPEIKEVTEVIESPKEVPEAQAAVAVENGEEKSKIGSAEESESPKESDNAEIQEIQANDKEIENKEPEAVVVESKDETTETSNKTSESEQNVAKATETKSKAAEESVKDVTIDQVVESPKSAKNESMTVCSPETVNLAESTKVKCEVPEKLTSILSWLHKETLLTAEQLEKLCVEEEDFLRAVKNVQPSAKREGFVTVPDVTWDDIGSLQDIRHELQMSILAPVRHAEHFETLGLTASSGVLLCGPPGCGKTLLAKAIANEAGINFISVKGPELLNMYVGESEKAVRQCFIRARNSAPCVIFFDELDALCPKRSEGDNNATSRVVNQMLTEMDGVESRKGVFLMAASNRPDIIDPAVLRPGRLDKILYVGLPRISDRVEILRALTKNGTKPRLASDVDLETISCSECCEGFTGADLAALVREAGIEALRDLLNGIITTAEVSSRHFNIALGKVRPSVQEKDIKHYEKLRKMYSVSRTLEDVPMDTPVNTSPSVELMET